MPNRNFGHLRFCCSQAIPLTVVLLGTVPAVAQTQPAGAVTTQALPSLVQSDSLSQALAKSDSLYRTRARALEKQNDVLKARIANAESIADRVTILEKALENSEARIRNERQHRVGDLQARYSVGFELFSSITTRIETLAVNLAAIDAYQAVTAVADIKQYAGFDDAYKLLLKKVGDSDEKKWLNNLLGSAVPKITGVVTTLSGLQSAMGVASYALKQLQSVLPAYVKVNLRGKELTTTMVQLSCGLETVNAVNADLLTSAAQNTELILHVDSVSRTLRTRLTSYRRLVNSPVTDSDVRFYTTTNSFFTQINNSTLQEMTSAEERFEEQAMILSGVARDYRETLDRHIAYWQTLRASLIARRNIPCLSSDTAAIARFNAAVTGVDNIVAKFKTTYLFDKTNVAAREYFVRETR